MSNLDFPPAAKTHDPVQSWDAAEKVDRKRGCLMVQKLIRRWPNSTRLELQQKCLDQLGWRAVDINNIPKRISDAKEQGMIQAAGTRLCTESNRSAETWVMA